MPSPEEGRFHTPRGKGPGVAVGEKLVIRKLPSLEELALRVQILERVIARAPFIGLDYSSELKRAGLQRRDLVGEIVIPE